VTTPTLKTMSISEILTRNAKGSLKRSRLTKVLKKKLLKKL